MMKQFSRREILRYAAAGAGTLMLPRFAVSAASAPDEPHFFLKVLLNGGADMSYLFDARPLAMTAAGKIQNYLGQAPSVWTGSNGTTCLASPLTQPLQAHRDNFSILNGVMMDAGANGHPQNMNYLYTGNSFGGESFIPYLNFAETGQTPSNLDAIQNGSIFASLTNTGSIVNIDAKSSDVLRGKLRKLPPASPSDELLSFIASRYEKNGEGSGRFSAAARAVLGAYNRSPDLQGKLLKLRAAGAGKGEDQLFMDLVCGYFQAGIARSAIWVFPEAFDVHDADAAKRQPKMFTSAAARLALVFKKLKETPFDKKRSMLEVTTVMVATEFGRTLRNLDAPIENTGTNHNQLSNSMLIGGKGIRGGLVLGASDYRTADAAISGAHRSLDADLIQVMGQPFDFKTMKPRQDLPAHFDVKDYLVVDSVVNTVYSLFGVSRERYRKLGRNEPIAPTLGSLLS